jgi:tetratricopeptide (TPR) repeat protein
VYAHTGRYLEAEPLLRRSLELTERDLGREHPTVATVRANLGGVALALRRHAEGELLIVPALATDEKILGPDHPSVAWMRGLLGWLRADQGRHGEAESLLRSSLKVTEARPALGVHRGVSLTTLGRLHLDLGRHAEAEWALGRALELADAHPGLPEPAMARLLTTLAELAARTGRLEDGEGFCRRAQEAERRIQEWGGDPRLFLADRLKVEALLHAARGRHGTAEECYRQALAIYETTLGPEHFEATRVRESLSKLPKGRK